MADIDRLSAREFDEWQVAYTIEPWGELRSDIRTAHQSAHLIGIHVDKRHAHQAPKPDDLLIRFWEEPKRQMTPEDTVAHFEKMLLGH